MAFPAGWNRKCPLVIQVSRIDSDLTYFPVLLTENTFPLEMFDADGSYSAINGGGDIRFSSDSEGNTQLACEVVTFITDNDPNNGKAEIWVKVPSISSSTNTIIYVWYNAAYETQPTSSGTYGSENVWDSNFKAVYHLNKDPSGTAPQELDSTTNNNNGSSAGSMTSNDLVDGKIAKALDFDGSDDYVDGGNDDSLNITNTVTVEVWVNPNNLDNDTLMAVKGYYNSNTDNGGYLLRAYKDAFELDIGNNAWGYAKKDSEITIGEWQQLVGVYDGSSTIKIYKNGVELTPDMTSNAPSSIKTVSQHLGIAYISDIGFTNYHFNGLIDEVHISSVARSAAWISACYNNQNDPSTFVIEGTPEYVNSYYFSGYVFEQNNPVSRKLYLHNRATSELVNTTMSSGDGYYYMETSFSGSHYIVCLDDAAGVDYNDLIIGPAFPTVASG